MDWLPINEQEIETITKIIEGVISTGFAEDDMGLHYCPICLEDKKETEFLSKANHKRECAVVLSNQFYHDKKEEWIWEKI